MAIHPLAYLCVGIASLYPNSVAQSPEQGFYNFLNISMTNYNSWAVVNDLEPLHISGLVNFTGSSSTIEYTGEGRNHTLHGLSKVDTDEDWKLRIDSRLLGGFFEIVFYTKPGFQVEGEYNVNGSIFSTIPIQGAGHFNSISELTAIYVWQLRFENFQVIDDHIRLSENRHFVHSEINGESLGIRLDGLKAGGYEIDVGELFEVEYMKQMHDFLGDILFDNFKRYFQELFDNTPVSEIIQTGWNSTVMFHNN